MDQAMNPMEIIDEAFWNNLVISDEIPQPSTEHNLNDLEED